MTNTTYSARFAIEDMVIADDETSIKMTVTGVAFYSGRQLIECNWFHNGALMSGWFDYWRLREVE